jgi:adenine-specific DNA-methyltransferase
MPIPQISTARPRAGAESAHEPDLYIDGELKVTGTDKLFVIFGKPDIKIEGAGDGMIRVKVKVFGVDVVKPQTGEVVSEATDCIVPWMLDTDHNEDSFFVGNAYFLGVNDPCKARRPRSRPILTKKPGRAFIPKRRARFRSYIGQDRGEGSTHLGDEAMKVFAVG